MSGRWFRVLLVGFLGSLSSRGLQGLCEGPTSRITRLKEGVRCAGAKRTTFKTYKYSCFVYDPCY